MYRRALRSSAVMAVPEPGFARTAIGGGCDDGVATRKNVSTSEMFGTPVPPGPLWSEKPFVRKTTVTTPSVGNEPVNVYFQVLSLPWTGVGTPLTVMPAATPLTKTSNS